MWAKKAAERGFIVIAPEYRLPDKPIGYKFTPEEHGAVELCLRDARRRFAVDSNRVHLAGHLHGGDMAWDYGLAHPDEFAGIAVISGLPFKYVFAYKTNADLTPLYIVEGGLTPGSEQVILDLARKLISSAVNLTYVDYPTRGQENIPGEIGPILDWMSRQKREPFPKEFKAVAARASDNRFYGIVIRELDPTRSPDPASVAENGANLKPATIEFSMSSISNLVKLQTQGVRQLDVWVHPKHFDFSKKLEIRINGKARFKDIPPNNPRPLLEDLRVRGDREQAYWFKLSIGGEAGNGAGAGGGQAGQ